MNLSKVRCLIAVLAAAAGLQGAYVNGELLWEGDFTTREGAARAGKEALEHFRPDAGPDGKGALVFRTRRNTETDWIRIPLPAGKLAGMIQLEAVVSGKDLAPGGRPFWGSKVMLNFQSAGKSRWPETSRNFGTYAWSTAGMAEVIPADAANLGLYLGIQGASGEFRVATVRIYRCVEGREESREIPANPIAAAIPRGPGHGTKYRGVMSGGDLSPEAFRRLADWGVNLIRYQLNPGLNTPRIDLSTREGYLRWIEAEMQRLDEVLKLCRQYDIKAVIDLHAGPGNRISKVSSNEIDIGLDVDTLTEAWRRMAKRYKGNPSIYGYDILNEPVNNRTPSVDLWQQTAERVTSAIRAIDRKTPIIIAAGFSISQFGNFKPLRYENIIYSPHFYEPFAYTHQGVGGAWKIHWRYPGWINGVYWDKEQLRVSMKDAIEFQRKYQVPIFVGEFSVIVRAPGGERYLKDMIELLEEYGWDWTYHAFREWAGWSLEHESTPDGKILSSKDNPRMRVVVEAFRKNRRPVEP